MSLCQKQTSVNWTNENILNCILNNLVFSLQARVAEDIKKRLVTLEGAWNSNKLCTVVQQRMAKLSTGIPFE